MKGKRFANWLRALCLRGACNSQKTLQVLSRTRIVWSWTSQFMQGWRYSKRAKSWCMISIITRLKGNTEKDANLSTPIRTAFCWRYKLTTPTRISKATNICTTQAIIQKIIRFTAPQTKRFRPRWKTRQTERQWVCLPSAKSVLNPGRDEEKHQKVERYEKVRCEKRNKARAELQWGAFLQKTYGHEMNMLLSEGHEIYGVRLNKTSLTPFDSKRYIAEDGKKTHLRIDTEWHKRSLMLTEFLGVFRSQGAQPTIPRAQSLAWFHRPCSGEQVLWE